MYVKLAIRFRKLMALTISASTVLGYAPITTYASDYKGHWAENAIERWREKGIVSGYEDGSFKPQSPITRAELASIVTRMFGLAETKGTESYADVNGDKWYAKDIAKISAAKIIYTEGTNFRPDALATREDVAYAIAEAYAVEGDSKKEFKDKDKVSEWALEAVSTLMGKGYVVGRPDGSFAPKDTITRAEVVSMIDKITAKLYNKSGMYTEKALGNVVINSKDVILKDMTIEGNLYIAQGVGEGGATLENVVVKGSIFVEGGGLNSVYLKDTIAREVCVNKQNDQIRLVVTGKTKLGEIVIHSGVKVENKDFLGSIERILIGEGTDKEDSIQLLAPANTLYITAPAHIEIVNSLEVVDIDKLGLDSEITILKTGNAKKIIANTGVMIRGTGMIGTLEAKANGIVSEIRPSIINIAPGIENPKVPELVQNGGGGSSPTSQKVNVKGVSLDKNELNLKVGEESTLQATVTPSNATNKKLKWQSSNNAVATVTEGVVKAIGKGNAVITVTTEDGNKTATCNVNILEKGYTFKDGVLTIEEPNTIIESKDIGTNTITTLEIKGAAVNSVIKGIRVTEKTIICDRVKHSLMRETSRVIPKSVLTFENCSLQTVEAYLPGLELNLVGGSADTVTAKARLNLVATGTVDTVVAEEGLMITQAPQDMCVVVATDQPIQVNSQVASLTVSSPNQQIALNANVENVNLEQGTTLTIDSAAAVQTVTSTAIGLVSLMGSGTIEQVVAERPMQLAATASVNTVVAREALTISSMSRMTSVIVETAAPVQVNAQVAQLTVNASQADVAINSNIETVNVNTSSSITVGSGASITTVSSTTTENVTLQGEGTISKVQTTNADTGTIHTDGMETKPEIVQATTLRLISQGNSSVQMPTTAEINSTPTIRVTANKGYIIKCVKQNGFSLQPLEDKNTYRLNPVEPNTEIMIETELGQIAVESITLSEASLELEIGKTSLLKATITPSNATNKKIIWKSSDTAIATVTNGNVVATSEGIATITATTVDGQKVASCSVTVIKPITHVTLSGTVMLSGKPVAGAAIEVWKTNEQNTNYTAISDVNGHYSIQNIPIGSGSIHISYRDEKNALYYENMTADFTGDKVCDATLKKARLLEIDFKTSVNAEAKPLDYVMYDMKVVNENGKVIYVYDPARLENEKGHLTLECPFDTKEGYTLIYEIKKLGYEPRSGEITFKDLEQPISLELREKRVSPEWKIEGKVLVDGVPAEGAKVDLRYYNKENQWPLVESMQTTTEGAYSFKPQTEGDYWLGILFDKEGKGYFYYGEVPVEKDVNEIHSLKEASYIVFKTQDDAGKVLPFTKYEINLFNGDQNIGRMMGETNENGEMKEVFYGDVSENFRFNYTLWTKGYEKLTGEMDFRSGENKLGENGILKLNHKPVCNQYSVSGKVFLESEPVKDAKVTLVGRGSHGEWDVKRYDTTTDESGSYNFEGIEEGDYAVEARYHQGNDYYKGSEWINVYENATQVSEVKLQRINQYLLEGTVKLEGKPVPGAKVELWGNDENYNWVLLKELESDPNGNIRVAGLLEGDYHLEIRYEKDGKSYYVSRPIQLSKNMEHENFALQMPRRLNLNLQSEDNQPIHDYGYYVMIVYDKDGNERGKWENDHSNVFDANCEFDFSEGDYLEYYVDVPGYERVRVERLPLEAATTNIDVTLKEKALATMNGIVKIGDTVVEGAAVELWRDIEGEGDKVRYTVTTGVDGTYSLQGIKPNWYFMKVIYKDQAGEKRTYYFNESVDLSQKNIESKTIVLKESSRITVKVMDEQGNPLKGCGEVVLRDDKGNEAARWQIEDSAEVVYEYPYDITPGFNYEYRVEASGYETTTLNNQEITEGDNTITVQLAKIPEDTKYTLTGKLVLNPEDIAPVMFDSGEVILYKDGTEIQAPLYSSGSYIFQDLTNGDYSLEVHGKVGDTFYYCNQTVTINNENQNNAWVLRKATQIKFTPLDEAENVFTGEGTLKIEIIRKENDQESLIFEWNETTIKEYTYFLNKDFDQNYFYKVTADILGNSTFTQTQQLDSKQNDIVCHVTTKDNLTKDSVPITDLVEKEQIPTQTPVPVQ